MDLKDNAKLSLRNVKKVLSTLPSEFLKNVEVSRLLNKLDGYVNKIDKLTLTLCFIGPAKSGKSTSINALLGLNVAPSEAIPCTAVPTIFRHCPGFRHLRLILSVDFIALFDKAVLQLQDISEFTREKCNNLSNTEIKMLNRISEYPQSNLLVTEVFEIGEQRQGVERLRERLCWINSMCRLFAKVELLVSSGNGENIALQTNPLNGLVGLGDHWPIVELEMEVLKGMDITGLFQVMDTPGLDETSLLPSIGRAVTLALEYSDAAVCVLNCTNPSPDSVQSMQSKVKVCCDLDHNVYVLANHVNGISPEESKSSVVEALGRGIFRNNYEKMQCNVFGTNAKLVSFLEFALFCMN